MYQNSGILNTINTFSAWDKADGVNSGAGIKIGIIDTGVDASHLIGW